ncbi:MAG: hypothetical protein QOI48_4547 [Solirubrobacteraceae bacterium]|nr:hypothetical protein [Solirubrobacteraceae bacterium]
MQKVEGSSPFIRLHREPRYGGVFSCQSLIAVVRIVGIRAHAVPTGAVLAVVRVQLGAILVLGVLHQMAARRVDIRTFGPHPAGPA